MSQPSQQQLPWGSLARIGGSDASAEKHSGPFTIGGGSSKSAGPTTDLALFGRQRPSKEALVQRAYSSDAVFFEIPANYVSSVHFSIERRLEAPQPGISGAAGEGDGHGHGQGEGEGQASPRETFILTDHSRNGTDVDGMVPGIGKTAVLHDQSVISLLFKQDKKIVFCFTAHPPRPFPHVNSNLETSTLLGGQEGGKTAGKAGSKAAPGVEAAALAPPPSPSLTSPTTPAHGATGKLPAVPTAPSAQAAAPAAAPAAIQGLPSPSAAGPLAAQLREVDAVNKVCQAHVNFSMPVKGRIYQNDKSQPNHNQIITKS